jgi:hypothetical protein
MSRSTRHIKRCVLMAEGPGSPLNGPRIVSRPTSGYGPVLLAKQGSFV